MFLVNLFHRFPKYVRIILIFFYFYVTLALCPFLWNICMLIFYSDGLFILGFVVGITMNTFFNPENKTNPIKIDFIYNTIKINFNLILNYFLLKLNNFFNFFLFFKYSNLLLKFKLFFSYIFKNFFIFWNPLFKKFSYFGFFRNNKQKWLKNKQ